MGSDRRGAPLGYFVVLLGVAWGCSGRSARDADGNAGNAAIDTAPLPGGASNAAGASSGDAGRAGAITTPSGGAAGAPVTVTNPSAGAAGAAAEPPLMVTPVSSWGGKPLDMVPYASSGSRLKAIGYADDGAVFFDTMRDTELGIDCAYEQTETGDWLCAPIKKQSLIYLDAACSDPAVEATALTTPTGDMFGLYTTTADGSGGDDTVLRPAHPPVYRVGEVLFESNGTTTYAEETLSIYTLNGTTASPCMGPRQANRHVVTNPPSVFRVIPVADSELVKGTVRHVPLEQGLSLQRLVTEDGSQLSGRLELDGRECELQRSGVCVPAPVGAVSLYADADCQEWAFRLPSAAPAGAPVYGVELNVTEDTTTVYELAPATTVYSRKTRVDMVMMNGQSTPVEVLVSCDPVDVSSPTSHFYRRSREVTKELPKLDTVQLGGSAGLSPIWFFGVLAGTDTRVQVQIHSPEGTWVRPNIRTSDGTVCSVYDDRFKDQCLQIDGVTFIPVEEVGL